MCQPYPQKTNPSLKGLVVLTFHILFLIAALDSEGLKKWAEQLKQPELQNILLPPLTGWYEAMGKIGLTKLRRLVREDLFMPFQGLSFAPPPAMTLAPPLANTLEQFQAVYSASHPLDILVLGDSLAGLALPPAFYQVTANNRCLRVHYIYKISSSVANTQFYYWAKEVPNIIQAYRQRYQSEFELIIVILGSNDAQAIREGEQIVPFNDPAWLPLFEARARELIEVLVKNSMRIYWVSVPPMRKEGYRERMLQINDIYRRLVSDYPSVYYFDLTPLLGDEQGHYTHTKLIDGQYQILRASDGIHLENAGAKLIVKALMEHLQKDFAFKGP